MASITTPESHSADHQPHTAPAAIDAQSLYFQRLVVRIAGKDRIAFAELYDALSAKLYCEIRSVLASPVRPIGVLAATFVEVWALARFHAGAGDDAQAWVTDIAVRRTMDRTFAGDGDPDEGAADHAVFPRSQLRWTVLADSHDRQYLLSLAALLNRPHLALRDDPGSRQVGGHDAASTRDLAVEQPQRSTRTTSEKQGCSAADENGALVHLATMMPSQCSSRRMPRAPETS